MLDNEQLRYMRDHGLSWWDLYDFPMSWDWWRHYSVYNTAVDPGPNRVKKPAWEPETITAKGPPKQEVEAEERGLRQIKEDIEQLRLGLRYTQQLQARSPRKPSRKRKGVPL